MNVSVHLKPILGSTAWLALLQLASYVLPLFTIPVVTRALGPELFGLVASLMAMAAYLSVTVSYGFPWTGPRIVARRRTDIDALSTAMSGIVSLQVIICLVSGTAFLLLMFTTIAAQSFKWVAFLTLVSAAATSLTPSWFFVGLEKMRDVAIPQIVTRLAATLLIIALVRTEGDVTLYVGINAVASLVSLAMFAYLIRKVGVRFRTPTAEYGRTLLKESRSLFVSNLAVSGYTHSNVLIVSLTLGNAAAGIFALADRIRQAALGVFTPLTHAIYPFICRTIGSVDASDQLAKKQFFVLMMAVATATSASLFVLAPLAVEVLGGRDFEGAIVLTRIFAAVPLAVVLSNILGFQTMLPLGMDREVSIILTGSAIVGVCLQVFLTHLLGLVGSAWAYLLTETAVCLAMAITLAFSRRSDRGKLLEAHSAPQEYESLRSD